MCKIGRRVPVNDASSPWIEGTIVIAADKDFVRVGEGGQPIYLFCYFGYGTGVGQIPSMDEQVTRRNRRSFGMRIRDADDL